MPQLRNPTEFRLSCYLIGDEFIGPGESVEITDEQADALEHGAIFIVEREPSATPVRESVKRGGKRAEVSKAPAVETRGMTTESLGPRG